jgi:hypothetical protein
MSFGVREHPRITVFAEGSEREAVPHGTVIKGLGSFPKVWVFHDDPSFIVLTETKFSFRCIPVWDRYSPPFT